MEKKKRLITYLLNEKARLERERGHVVTLTAFATLVDLPLRTVTGMFDPEDDRVPIEANAAKVALALYSNRIMQILEYQEIDPMYLQLKKAFDQLPRDDKVELIDEMEARAKGVGVSQPAMI